MFSLRRLNFYILLPGEEIGSLSNMFRAFLGPLHVARLQFTDAFRLGFSSWEGIPCQGATDLWTYEIVI